MWLLIYLLIFLVPVAFIILAFALIGGAGARVYRNGKRTYVEFKPYINKLSADAQRAQQRGTSFADRGQKMAKAVDELSGRWAFISGSIADTRNSPVIKLAGAAGKFAAEHEKKDAEAGPTDLEK